VSIRESVQKRVLLALLNILLVN